MRIKTRIYALLTAVLAVVLAFSFLGKPAFARATGYIVSSYLTPSGAGQLCLDAAFDDNGHNPSNNGDPVQLWTCTDSFNQTWNTPDPGVWGTITSVSGLCLDAVASGATSDGDNVQLWACNGGLQQQWKTVPPNPGAHLGSKYVENGYGLYLDAQTDATHNPTQNGDKVQLYSYNGAEQQQWY